MVGLWTILWPNGGLFWDPFMAILWLVYGLFYGLIRGCFVTFVLVLWLVSGLFYGLTEDCFVPCFMAGL